MPSVLYSFRRCPYAMRARLAIYLTQQVCELREVVLKNKPQEMLQASPKGTVPVLLIGGGEMGSRVLDESIDIMHWAIGNNTPLDWSLDELSDPLVELNDSEFKYYLDRYKYYDRYPEHPQGVYLDKARFFLERLEASMSESSAGNYYLRTPVLSALDIAILPFIRQFAFVDKAAFDELCLPPGLPPCFPKLHIWLTSFLASSLFKESMHKYPAWSYEQQEPVLFPS